MNKKKKEIKDIEKKWMLILGITKKKKVVFGVYKGGYMNKKIQVVKEQKRKRYGSE